MLETLEGLFLFKRRPRAHPCPCVPKTFNALLRVLFNAPIFQTLPNDAAEPDAMLEPKSARHRISWESFSECTFPHLTARFSYDTDYETSS